MQNERNIYRADDLLELATGRELRLIFERSNPAIRQQIENEMRRRRGVASPSPLVTLPTLVMNAAA